MQLYCEHTRDLLTVLQYCLSNSHRRKAFILNALSALEQADSKHTHTHTLAGRAGLATVLI